MDWWEIDYEHKDKREPSLLSIAPSWNSFWDTIKEKYYPIKSYEYKCISLPCCNREGTKMCRSSQIFSIHFTQSLVSRIRRKIWYSSITTNYTSKSKMRWSSWTSPFLALLIDMMSRSSKNLNKRRKALDLQIWIKGKEPPNRRTKDKAKVRRPNKKFQSRKKIKAPRKQIRTQINGVSATTGPLKTQVSFKPSIH